MLKCIKNKPNKILATADKIYYIKYPKRPVYAEYSKLILCNIVYI